MAKKPDTPCAGGCGALLWGGGTSLPAGRRTCRPCRKAGRGPTTAKRVNGERRTRVVRLRRQGLSYRRIAPLVGVSVDTVMRELAAAGERTRAVRKRVESWNRRPHPCVGCASSTTRNSPRCGGCASVHRSERNQRKNLRRRAGGTRIMAIRELAERDRWRCHLCRRPVGRTLRYPHPRAASRDHLIPVADGGTNDPANLALAHWVCNVRRRTGGSVQLRLVA